MNFSELKTKLLNWKEKLSMEPGIYVYRGGERKSNSDSRFGKKKFIEADDTTLAQYLEDESHTESGAKKLLKKDIDLNKKVEDYLTWYSENIINTSTPQDNKRLVMNLRNFIEKMAVWYELRYPNYDVENLPNNIQSSSDTMIYQNLHIEKVIEKHCDNKESIWEAIKQIKWEDFYNTKAFINSLTECEKEYLERPKYPSTIWCYISKNEKLTRDFIIISLTANGKICNFSFWNYFKIDTSKIIGMTLQEFVSYLKEKGYQLKNTNETELEDYIQEYEKQVYRKEELLNCVMYRIIERGGEYYGPIRGYIFAKEFFRDKDLPIQYAMEPWYGLESLFQYYLADGGNFDLRCFVNYFVKEQNEEIQQESIRDYFKEFDIYTKEETEAHQNFVNFLATYQKVCDLKEELLFQEELLSQEEQQDPILSEKEEVQAKRLQRKLDKSRNNKYKK